MGQYEEQIVTDEISLRELSLKARQWIIYLWAKKFLIFLSVLLGSLLGLILSHYDKPIYTAATTFVLEEGNGGGALGQYAGMAAMVGIDLSSGGGGLFQGDNIFELYKSRRMLQTALLSKGIFDGKSQSLIDRYLEFNKIRDSWKDEELRRISFVDTAKFGFLQDSVLGVIVTNIKKNDLVVGKPDKKLSILKVEVKSRDEQFAKAFNEKLVSTVNQFYIDTKAKKSIENVKILKRQADSVRSVMSSAIFSSASTIDATPNLNPTRQILRAPVQNSQYHAETNKVILSELVKQLELAKIMMRKEMPLIQVVDSPVYPLERTKLGRTKAVLIGFSIAGFLIVFGLILRKLYFDMVNER